MGEQSPLFSKKGDPCRAVFTLKVELIYQKRVHRTGQRPARMISHKRIPDSVLRNVYRRALEKQWTNLLTPKPSIPLTDVTQPTWIIGTYDNASHAIRDILNRHWHILTLDPDLKDTVGPSPQITYRRGRNFRDRLVHSHFTQPRTNSWLSRQPCGCHRCSGCVACTYLQTCSNFLNNDTSELIQIKHFINCWTMRVIYRAQCNCGLSYIGKTTQEFRRRVGEHLGEILNQRDTPIARHTWSHHNGDTQQIKFMGIDHIILTNREGDIDRLILQRETWWIFKLGTMSPNGLNKQMDFTCYIYLPSRVYVSLSTFIRIHSTGHLSESTGALSLCMH